MPTWVRGLRIEKDPDADKDWKFDWSDWLAAGDTIQSFTITVPAGLTKHSDTITDAGQSVTVWFSGGVTGTSYPVTCSVVTVAGRKDDRTVIFTIRQQ